MKIFALVLMLMAGLTGIAAAGEYSLDNRPTIVFSGRGGERAHINPYPMSARAASVWLSDACWRRCAADCGWRFNACARADGPEACRTGLDRCDRACLWNCRTSGGPLLYSPE